MQQQTRNCHIYIYICHRPINSVPLLYKRTRGTKLRLRSWAGSARLDSARLRAARLGSARLGLGLASARLGSARPGPARLVSSQSCPACLGLVRLASALSHLGLAHQFCAPSPRAGGRRKVVQKVSILCGRYWKKTRRVMSPYAGTKLSLGSRGWFRSVRLGPAQIGSARVWLSSTRLVSA